MIYLIFTAVSLKNGTISLYGSLGGLATSPVVLLYIYSCTIMKMCESVCESVKERRANFLLQHFKNGIS